MYRAMIHSVPQSSFYHVFNRTKTMQSSMYSIKTLIYFIADTKPPSGAVLTSLQMLRGTAGGTVDRPTFHRQRHAFAELSSDRTSPRETMDEWGKTAHIAHIETQAIRQNTRALTKSSECAKQLSQKAECENVVSTESKLYIT